MEQASMRSRLVIYWLADKGKRQTELADAIGISRAAVNSWTRGKASPSEKHIPAIARYFGLTESGFYSVTQKVEAEE